MKSVVCFVVGIEVLALVWGQAGDITDPHGIFPIMRANDEIVLMTELAPLKLTPVQCQKLAAALRASREKFEKERKQLEAKEADSVKKLKSKVEAAHAKALKGELPGEEYFDEWNKMLMAGAVERANLRIRTVQSLGDEARKILTEDQYKKAVASAKTAITKAQGGKEPDPTKFGENSLFWYFVENILMHDAMPGLLDKLSKPRD